MNVVAAANETMEWVDSFRTAVPGSSIYCPDSRSEAVLDFVQWLEDELRSHDEQVRRRSENN